MPFHWNRTLLLLAAVGIVLYFSVVVIAVLDSGRSLAEEVSVVKVGREEAQAAALQFAERQFPELAVAKAEIVYLSDQTMSGYLQKNGLVENYEERWAEHLPLDYWQAVLTIGDPDAEAGSRQRLTVKIGMQEPVVFGWELSGHEPAAATEGGAAALRALAERGFSPEEWLLRAEPAEDATGRFVFDYVGEPVGEAKLQAEIAASAGRVTALELKFLAPDDYVTWSKRQERLGLLFTFVNLAFTFAAGIAALVFAVLNRRAVTFTRGIVFTLLYAAIYILFTVNSLPIVQAEAGTWNDSAANLFYVVFSAGLIVLLAAGLYLSAATGEQLWRDRGFSSWPRFSDPSFGKEVWYAMGRGYLLCLFVLGVQQVLLFGAEKSFGAFAVGDPTQSPLNMLWPALLPLVAWMAGISEEILYRLFAIAVFKKWFRSTFVAVLLSSLIWAFGHAGYTIYPSYTRIIEVTVLGFLFSAIFLRYGLLTAIFTHATMNSLLFGLSLMTGMPSARYVWIGLFYMALPAVVAFLLYVLHKAFGRPRPGAAVAGGAP